MSKGYGCPEPGAEEDITVPWMSSMHSMISNLSETRPSVGWWAPSCSLHTLLGHTEVRVEDRDRPGERISLYQAEINMIFSNN